MTQEEKQLLIKDLCARLPYWTNVLTEDNDKGYIIGVDDTEKGVFEIHILEDGDSYTCDESIENFKPYLRPLSSMTEEEFLEYHDIKYNKVTYRNNYKRIDVGEFHNVGIIPIEDYLDWLNVHHFDYRGLIEMGLALEAPEGMYKAK